tara:strand:+ start:794 stop:919 length:126 start_codon:yes stop_codon:yes gene_type:complete
MILAFAVVVRNLKNVAAKINNFLINKNKKATEESVALNYHL